MNRNRNLVLTGFMGTGKSTIGKEAASRLNLVFVDIDKIIENRMQKSISNIFSEYGESYFRRLEKETIEEYSRNQGQVISTGGGVVLDEENMRNLKSSGVVILLKARPEVIFRNVSKDCNRPLLQDKDPMNRIIQLLESREKYYKNNHYDLDVSDLTVMEAVDQVVRLYLMLLDNALS